MVIAKKPFFVFCFAQINYIMQAKICKWNENSNPQQLPNGVIIRNRNIIYFSEITIRNSTVFLPTEVALHNKPDDIWLSFLGKVYNITELIKKYEYKRNLTKPLIAYAGKDVSHWFDSITRDIRHHVHPITGVRVPYTPHGRVPHVLEQVPTTAWKPLIHLPWWADRRYVVGDLTVRARPVRILNMLTGTTNFLTVCQEDKLSRILERYLPHNSHAASYVWKYNLRVLDMDKTLQENNIPDDRDELVEIGIPEDIYIPCLMLYYSDDLTESDP